MISQIIVLAALAALAIAMAIGIWAWFRPLPPEVAQQFEGELRSRSEDL